MRISILVIFLLNTLSVFSQHYRTVSTDSEVHFDFLDAVHTRVIVTDSFQVVGNDTIIYHTLSQELEFEYDSFSLQLGIWYNLNDTGFLGYKTILQDDGTDIYFNQLQDSIFIQTQASLNETWIFYQNPNGDYFEATVTTVDTSHFLGIIDSVKTITLQAKDIFGNTVSSPYDTLVIKVSKHYGLIEGFNLFKFPYGVSTCLSNNYSNSSYYYNPIRILGFPKYNLGVDNLTAADIYDYDIGDEYHWETESTPGLGSGGGAGCYKTYDIITIQNKSFSNNGDSVYYNVFLERYEFLIDIDFSMNPSVTYSFDTLHYGNTVLTYYIGEDNPINILSFHNDGNYIGMSQTIDGNQKIRSTKTILPGNCFIQVGGGLGIDDVAYHKGIGRTYHSHGGTVQIVETKRSYIYYNKNGIEWGTPANLDSLLIVSTDEVIENNIHLKVFPNPAKDILHFQLEDRLDDAEIRIYSTLGQLITRQNINTNLIQFNTSDWHNGAYFYGIYVEGQLVKQGQFLIER